MTAVVQVTEFEPTTGWGEPKDFDLEPETEPAVFDLTPYVQGQAQLKRRIVLAELIEGTEYL